MTIRSPVLRASHNRLLAALSPADYRRLSPVLELVPLQAEEILYQPGQVIRHLYFPTGGIISLLAVLLDGAVAEVARIGNEGMVGLPVFLGVRRSQTRAFVPIGGAAFRINASDFLERAAERRSMSRLFLRYTNALMSHSAQLSACNGCHTVEQRLAQWLLLTQDRLQMTEFEVTHELLSRMLAAHRQSVTLAAGRLQRAGAIRYGRGRLEIANRELLESFSCECYRAVTRIIEQLFA